MANPFEAEMQYPDYAGLQRKRKMADMLMQQGGSPLEGQMVSGHYVSPGIAGALAKALMIYKGSEGAQEADTQTKALADQLKGQREAWMVEMPKGTDNTSQAGPVMPQKPTAEDYMAWALKGQQIDPASAQMGMQSANMALNRESQAEARTQQEQFRRDQLAQQAAQAEQQRALQREIAQMKNQPGQNAYYQPVSTANGVYAFNARTGKMELVQSAGSPVIRESADPTLQGNIAGAKEKAELSAKSGSEAQKAVRKSDVMLQQLDQAESLLKKGPTSSGIGAGVDALGNLVGVSSKSADTAAQLAAISGWLVANVPRMEGPQSNFDVQNYQTMAGLVGDKTKPVSQRMKALEEVRKLQQKYREFNQDMAGGQTAQPSAPKRMRFDAQGNMIP